MIEACSFAKLTSTKHGKLVLETTYTLALISSQESKSLCTRVKCSHASQKQLQPKHAATLDAYPEKKKRVKHNTELKYISIIVVLLTVFTIPH